MQLTIEDGTVITNLTPETLRAALAKLRQPSCNFAVLDARQDFYIQTAVNDDGSFVLEYQQGTLDDHYEVPYRIIYVEDVVDAFESFLLEDGRWKEIFEWEKVNFGDISPSVS